MWTPVLHPDFILSSYHAICYVWESWTELDRLVAEGTLKPLEYSDWAAPIVPVVKSDRKSVRICGDFEVAVNPVSKLHRYLIPKIEDDFASTEIPMFQFT